MIRHGCRSGAERAEDEEADTMIHQAHGVVIDLQQRTALVTGGGAGIGRAIARLLAAANARMVVNDLDAGRAAETCALIGDAGGTALAAVADVTDEAAVAALVATCVETHGSLDIAVNNVGMMGGLPARATLELDAAYIRRIVDLNLMSALLCSIAEGRAMAAGAGGVIVNVTSGETTRAAPGLVPYAAAKAAVNHLSRSLAVELAPHGIRVHAAAPGTTPTEHVRAAMSDEHLGAIAAATPLGRLCEPDDLARLVLFLVSDLSAAVTGQFVLADGGAHVSLGRPASAPPGAE